LLERAISLIKDLRQQAGISPSGSPLDCVMDLSSMCRAIEIGQSTYSQEQLSLLEAAGMIRDLRVVLDTDTLIRLSGQQA